MDFIHYNDSTYRGASSHAGGGKFVFELHAPLQSAGGGNGSRPDRTEFQLTKGAILR